MASSANSVSDLERAEHDGTYKVKKVSSFVDNGDGTLIRESTTNLSVRWDKDSTASSITYIGEATIGSADSGSVWRIQRIDSTNKEVKWASANFDQKWDDRELLTYL